MSVSELNLVKFLLASAPMINFEPDYIRRSVTPFAYIHPRTLASVSNWMRFDLHRKCYDFPPLPTKWLVTSLMPEGRVIFAQDPLPGMTRRFK